MKKNQPSPAGVLPVVCRRFFLLLLVAQVHAADPTGGTTAESLILSIEGRVEVALAGTDRWAEARTNQTLRVGDQIRTGFRSRATVRLSDLTVMKMNQLTTLQIQPPRVANNKPVLDLKSGGTYFLGRDKPTETEFRTPQTSGAILGTEFALVVTAEGGTELTMIDGVVRLFNDQGQVEVTRGEQGVVRPGQAPTKAPVIDATSIIQWSLYYPAVLNPDELALTDNETQTLAASLAAYRSGDLKAALASYPEGRTPASDAERIYLAGLVLAVGQVGEAESLLQPLAARTDPPGRLARALRRMIAAVQGPEPGSDPASEIPLSLATEHLAESYYHQARFQLEAALAAARAAAAQSPGFGFAWARVAELEFSFGRAAAAQAALERALELSPRNAQALALHGFTLAAQNRIAAAQARFDEAIAADSALGNAWLGRGLTKIRQGLAAEGRVDLQVAATLEPNRALLRSYLGKAFAHAQDLEHAGRELELAKRLDKNDPTAWLYSALLAQQRNQINRGISGLERSQSLNDNRRVFRSRLLLDQDAAVRGANLASLYRDAGMTDFARREASRAVDADYANHSAHLFLAGSYDALRDPNQVNLRYEAPWLSELLVANLLAPVGAGSLSQSVSQQEYSRLFERDRFGISSSTEYRSLGQWDHLSSQFGTFGSTSYAIDAEYHNSNGQQPNGDRDQLTLYAKFKQQITPQDTLLVQAIYYDAEAGDLAQYYNHDGRLPGLASPSLTFRLKEKQQPNIFAGWHHEWAPGSHTLFLAGRLHDDFSFSDPNGTTLTYARNAAGVITSVVPRGFGVNFDSELEAFTGELQHIQQAGRHTFIAGARAQTGELDNRAALALRPGSFPGPDVFPTLTQSTSHDLNRFSIYLYDHWQVLDSLRFTAGVTYDHLDFPRNSEIPPLTAGQESEGQLSPKLGLVWDACEFTALRAAYTRSLGGVFFDQSVRLEPSQIAGFNQSFRSLIPESVSGLVPGTEFETAGAALDFRLKTRTYLSLFGEVLASEGARTVGAFERNAGVLAASPAGTREQLDFRERTVGVVLNQLVGEQFSLGASYRLSQADLDDQFVNIPATATTTGGFAASRDLTATLHLVNLFARFHHACGFFSEVNSLWAAQSNHGYTPNLPGDDFWQFNLYAGYRFPNRVAEIRVGLLNVTDQDYRLNPLNLYYELPRERTLAASLKFNF